MSGFVFVYGKLKYESSYDSDDFILNDKIIGDNYVIHRSTLSKFIEDKVFYNSEGYIVVIEGIIVNKAELLGNSTSWSQRVIELYQLHGDSFYKDFRGSFSGLIYDKKQEKWIIFSDQIGSKHIYYSKMSGERYIFASNISEVYRVLDLNNVTNSLDTNAAYMLLSYGYMLGDRTLSTTIKRVEPGSYLKIQRDQLSKHEYFRFTNIPDSRLTEDDIIEQADFLFQQAIRRQFEKDLEYGYKHFVSLSGGLDSRMTSYVGNKLGYKNQLNFTFSQTNYLDETIPKKIAEDLRHEWIFKSLDNGLFLLDVDYITSITGGNVLYYSLAHIMSLYKYTDFTLLGIVHSGQLGDVILGTYSTNPYHINDFDPGSGAFSNKYLDQIEFSDLNMSYENEEMFKMYSRGFNGINSSALATHQFTETLSPFCDVDFMDFVLKIPLKLRFNHYIYIKLIRKKYPKLAGYIWERTKRRPTKVPHKISFKGKYITLQDLPVKLLEKVKLRKSPMLTKKHMNPFGYWYKTNEELRLYFDQYLKDSIDVLDSNPALKQDCYRLYSNGNAREKIQVISLLSAVDRFFK